MSLQANKGIVDDINSHSQNTLKCQPLQEHNDTLAAHWCLTSTQHIIVSAYYYSYIMYKK